MNAKIVSAKFSDIKIGDFIQFPNGEFHEVTQILDYSLNGNSKRDIEGLNCVYLDIYTDLDWCCMKIEVVKE